jgi:thymidylate synthase ThyX
MADLTDVQVIADSVGALPEARIITIQYKAPRFLLAEINTHGVLAKSAASSRAIPVAKRIQMVEENPYVPLQMLKNQKGMQSHTPLDEKAADEAREIWLEAVGAAIEAAKKLEQLGLHKQHANRVLETYSYADGILTATEWDNFYKLRFSKEAQPEFEVLAGKIHAAIKQSVPRQRQHHLPYATDLPVDNIERLREAYMVSAARCARISYKSLESGKSSTLAEDIRLCCRLLDQGHMSPFDHPAMADHVEKRLSGRLFWKTPSLHKRYWGWVARRTIVEAEAGMITRRDSFAPLREDKESAVA